MSEIGSKNRAISEASRYLYAILLIIQNNQEGVKIILQSGMNVTRSFMAYFWCLPAQLFMWSLVWRRNEIAEDATHVDFLITVSVFDAVAWGIFAISIYLIMVLASAEKLAAPMIIATNWFNLFATYVFFIPATMNYILPLGDDTAMIIEFVIYITIVGLYFRVVRHMLGNHKLFAFALTLVNVASSIFISSFIYSTV
ncbi:hypothetical protein [Lentilitoribacter sp. Alg239-R112]|uniref:hypothetical protein n=1 Tax=Lentilitoribacter sp. Alg239-R112 TaxID=2305987 RepID=UPI0013A69CA2|nr:hypothetical protein [Lentilitoribacter sp. Alg239-R112]